MLIAPSVLAADYSQLKNEIDRVKTADFIHLDIMDGHFVPNISFGADFVKALRPVTNIKFDVHLMISHPSQYVARFAEAGADIICFHVETTDDVITVIDKIVDCGKLPALAIKPDTPIEALYPYLEKIYMVLVMTVEPGFGGQVMRQDQLTKVVELKKRFPQLIIEADGGIGRGNIELCAKAGVDICVAGTSVFKAESAEAEITFMQNFI